jgi:hypothetical protein
MTVAGNESSFCARSQGRRATRQNGNSSRNQVDNCGIRVRAFSLDFVAKIAQTGEKMLREDVLAKVLAKLYFFHALSASLSGVYELLNGGVHHHVASHLTSPFRNDKIGAVVDRVGRLHI